MSKLFQKRENKLSQTKKGTWIFHMAFNNSTPKISLIPKNLVWSHIIWWSLGTFTWCLNIFSPGFIPTKMKMILGSENVVNCTALWLNDQLISGQEDLTRGRRTRRPQGTQGEGHSQARSRKEGDTSGDGWGIESHPCTLHTFLGLVTEEPNLHLRFINGDETMRWMYCVLEKMLN